MSHILLRPQKNTCASTQLPSLVFGVTLMNYLLIYVGDAAYEQHALPIPSFHEKMVVGLLSEPPQSLWRSCFHL